MRSRIGFDGQVSTDAALAASHLTQWQARYRRWFEATLMDDDIRDPQSVQQEFQKYYDLMKDLLEINDKLIEYWRAMHELATGDPENTIAISEEYSF